MTDEPEIGATGAPTSEPPAPEEPRTPGPAGDAAPALLVASRARVTIDDVVALEAFDLDARGSRLVLVGDASPLMALAGAYPLGLAYGAALAAQGEPSSVAGRARLASGTMTLLGRDVGARAHVDLVGAAPFEPPLPADVTLVDWLFDAARLALGSMGKTSRAEVRARVSEVVARAQLGGLARAKLATLPRAARRALILAQAALARPAVVVAELPLAGLEASEAAPVLAAFEALFAETASIVSVGRLDAAGPEHGFIRRADHVAAFTRAELAYFGPPEGLTSRGRLYRVTVVANAAALRDALRAEGLVLDGGPERFSLALPEGKGPTDVLVLASQARASVVEIVPVM
ncbi:MAG TPA: hypothetical protein VL400_08495 [Polyangiaceae bacterium]|nr:hypothetical protein [Polyangiaceae bacterium]